MFTRRVSVLTRVPHCATARPPCARPLCARSGKGAAKAGGAKASFASWLAAQEAGEAVGSEPGDVETEGGVEEDDDFFVVRAC